MEEVWRDVFGYEGLYQVSNKEHLINLETNHLIVGYIHDDYRIVSIGGKDERFHRIVARAFPDICGKWFEGCLVHHKDRNKLNNVPDNLEVISRSNHQSEHNKERDYGTITQKRLKTIKKRYPFGVGAVAIEQYNMTGELINSYNSIKEASESTNLDSATICNALKGKIRSYGGFIWKYKKEGD